MFTDRKTARLLHAFDVVAVSSWHPSILRKSPTKSFRSAFPELKVTTACYPCRNVLPKKTFEAAGQVHAHLMSI